MLTDLQRSSPSALQLMLSTEALKRARHIVGAQAQMLADKIDRGCLPSFDGPDALRLLAMILNQDDEPSVHGQSYAAGHFKASALT